MAYAPTNVDYFAYMDWQALIPGLWDSVSKFEKQPHARELAKDLNLVDSRKAVKGQLAVFQKRVGFDFINDIHWLSVWLGFGKTGDGSNVRGLAMIRAKLPVDFLQRISTLVGQQVETEGGVSIIRMRGGAIVIGITNNGLLAIGSSELVIPRLAPSWKGRRGPKGELGRHLTKALKSKPALVFGSEPGESLRKQLRGTSLPRAGRFVAEVLTAHDVMVGSLRHNGVDLVWKARSAAGFKTAKLGMEGAVDLLRASHPVVRGAVKLGLAALRTYVARHKEYSRLLRHEKFLLKYVDRWVGDGTFKTRLRASARTRVLALSLTDKSVIRILPLSALVPVALFIWADRTNEIPPAEFDQSDKSSGVQQTGSFEYTIDKQKLDELLDPAQLSTQVRIIPYYRAGNQEGIKLIGVRTGSFYRQLGMQSGDIVRSINGKIITRLVSAMDLFTKFETDSRVTLEVIRRAETIQFNYLIK
jgi:hypothetical protein